MFEFDTDFILYHTPPDDWSSKEVEQIKELFRRSRPEISATLAKRLWQYWRDHVPDRPLFEKDDENNVSLLLHARAYGEAIPQADDTSYSGRLLKEQSKLFAPLMPEERLTWGPRAALASEVLAALDSPVMHAWVFDNGSVIQKILIVGEGLPEFRTEVLQAAFRASLQVNSGANDIMNIGLLGIEVPGTPEPPLDIPFPIIGDRQIPLSFNAAETAEAALQELTMYLKKLEQDSGLVQVHRLHIDDHLSISKALREHATTVSVHRDRVLLWKGEQQTDLVSNIPYWRTSGSTMAVSMMLSADLLRTDAYERLWEAYEYATIQRLLMGIGARRDYYKREIERLETRKTLYDQTPLQERTAIWGATATITGRFDPNTAMTIMLAQPIVIAMEKFYLETVPALIEEYRKWLKRMEKIIYDIQISARRPDTPVRRLAASRFFDAAIRSLLPDESRAEQSAFKAWSSQVQPLLWFELRSFLQAQGIQPEQQKDIFTKHTFFHTKFSPTEDGQEVGRLVILPYTLVDQKRSVTLFDAKRRVMIVRDARDKEERESTSPKNDTGIWQDLQSQTSEEGFISALREALRQNPAAIVQHILDILIEGRRIRHPDSPLTSMQDDLEKAQQKTERTRKIKETVIALRFMAFQTARQSLHFLEEQLGFQAEKPHSRAEQAEDNWAARLYLIRAIIECIAENLPLKELSKVYHHSHTIVRPAIQTALDMAEDANEEYVADWIKRLEGDESKAIGHLLQGLPRGTNDCTKAQQAALLVRGAVEAARLARELDQKIETIAEEREAVATTFSKVGWELENMLLAEFGAGPQDELYDLVTLLTRQEPIQFPTV